MTISYLKRYRRIYLASPYTKLAPGLDYACDLVCIIAARLAKAGIDLYCPIAHWHTIATRGGIDPVDAPLFLPFNTSQQDDCEALVVAKIDGWQESDGVSVEIAHAALRNQPTYGIDPNNMKLSKWGYE